MLITNKKWIIGYSYGDFEFLTNIENYIEKYEIVVDKEVYYQGDRSEDYVVVGRDLYITCENGLIDAINVKDEILYGGVNLIGAKIFEFEKLLKTQHDRVGVSSESDYVEYSDGSLETCYEFDSLGAQVWVTDHDIITTVVVMPIFADDDMKNRIFPGRDQ